VKVIGRQMMCRENKNRTGKRIGKKREVSGRPASAKLVISRSPHAAPGSQGNSLAPHDTLIFRGGPVRRGKKN